MKYLLDTNTCVQYLRYRTVSAVAARLAAAQTGDVGICSIVTGELLFGALRSRNTNANLAEVKRFVAGFTSLSFDDLAAESYAAIRNDLTTKGTIIGPNDLMIAAIALVHSLILVTHNTAEFSRVVGLQLEDWQ